MTFISHSSRTTRSNRILQGARAVDKDQQGPFNTVEYQVVPGLYSDYVAFVSPLAGTLVLRKALDYETLPNFTVTLRAQDHGTPPKYSDTQLHVLVEDADDQNPRFLHDAYRAVLPDDLYVGALAVRPEPLRAVDQDVGLCAPVQYAIVPSMESRHFAIDAHSGNVSVVAALPSLNGLLTITLVVRATQINNADRYALTTLVVTGKEVLRWEQIREDRDQSLLSLNCIISTTGHQIPRQSTRLPPDPLSRTHSREHRTRPASARSAHQSARSISALHRFKS